MKKSIIGLIVLTMVVSITGCGKNSITQNTTLQATKATSAVEASDDDILKVIDDKVKNINDRKLDKYLSAYVNNTDTYNAEKLDKTNYFKQYKVKCSVENKKVINKTKDSAQIQYEIKTSKVKGPGFLDNSMLVIDQMKKVNNQWKIDEENTVITEYNDSIYNVINKSIKALNEKDISTYMDTIDKSNQDTFSSYRDQQLDSFDKYDLLYSLESADITSRSDADTQVKFSETIVKKGDSDFKNNRTSGIIHLKKVGNDWKISKIEVQKTEDLK